jgi:hypothetical protein
MPNPITTAAVEACLAGLSPAEAVELACSGRNVTPSVRTRIEGICEGALERVRRLAAARRAETAAAHGGV